MSAFIYVMIVFGLTILNFASGVLYAASVQTDEERIRGWLVSLALMINVITVSAALFIGSLV